MKTVLVTGGASGIGRAVAMRFAEEGHRVLVADINGEAAGEVVADLIDVTGNEDIIAVPLNVACASQVAQLFAYAANVFGGIDVLVNAAGITRDGMIVKMTEEAWDAVLNVNLKGSFLTTQAFLRQKRPGSIVNFTSIVGQSGNLGQANYAASKGGVIALTQTAAREGARGQVRVNAIAPGFVSTPMTDAVPEAARSFVVERTPLKRMGLPIEIAEAAVFLSSDEASYITGAVMNVDGGLTL